MSFVKVQKKKEKNIYYEKGKKKKLPLSCTGHVQHTIIVYKKDPFCGLCTLSLQLLYWHMLRGGFLCHESPQEVFFYWVNNICCMGEGRGFWAIELHDVGYVY